MRALAMGLVSIIGCNEGKENIDTAWPEETLAPEAATSGLHELDDPTGTAQAGADSQEMGCIGYTADLAQKVYAVLPTLTSTPSEALWGREATLYMDRASISENTGADSDGAFRFILPEEGVDVSTGEHIICIVGNPGEVTGEFQYQIASPDQFAIDGYLGADQTFPVAFTPFNVE